MAQSKEQIHEEIEKIESDLDKIDDIFGQEDLIEKESIYQDEEGVLYIKDGEDLRKIDIREDVEVKNVSEKSIEKNLTEIESSVGANVSTD